MSKNFYQISLTLLELFDAPQIIKRISSSLDSIVNNPAIKDTIFSIALIEVLDIDCKFSLVSEVADNDVIYDSNLRDSEGFRNLFKISECSVISKSSIFCLSLIRNNFSASYITNQLQKVAKKFDLYQEKNYEQRTIFKSLLRFAFVERLLPGKMKKANMRNYYENLKISIRWLTKDPHFWLQYGMANITFKEYDKAQQYFNQSYSIAYSKKQDYDTRGIDAQQARLYILIAIEEKEPFKAYNEFEKANSLLTKLDDSVYKFRQVEKYKDYYEFCYDTLSRKNQVNFLHACREMRKAIDDAESRGYINAGDQKTICRTKKSLDHVISEITFFSKKHGVKEEADI
ncbi:hypothetical protein [Zooshikella sp. RANM57]|uniref:hypothetical protein n=1 Tax=Zooshikella sp. RANM57 TaxID=3425863 RepID=UPI003D6E4D69